MEADRTEDAGPGDVREGTRPRASLYLDHHGQPCIDIPDPEAIERGQRAICAGHGDEKESTRPKTSFYLDQYG